jgi:hypothetical protein
LTVAGGAAVAKKLFIGGTLGVTGATTLSSTLGVTDAVTLSSTLGVTGNTTLSGTLGVTGAVSMSNNLSVTGNLTVGGPILSIPTGNTSARPASPLVGYVRYNTETSQFEGYGAGNSWGSLGGVSDVNQDTKILAEMSAGANDDNLRFFNNGAETMRLTATGKLGIGTNAPDKKVEINSTTGECLRLTYNNANGSAINYCDLTLNPTGSLTFTPTGPNPNVSFVSNVSASSYSASKQNIANNTADFPLSLTILPATAAENGLGTGIEFNSLNDAFTIFSLGTMEYYSIDVTDGNESSNCRWRLANNGQFNTAAYLSNIGVFTCTSVIETSDIRVKENIKDVNINESIDKIMNLDVKSYNYIHDSEKKNHVGFIAQEVREYMPEVVQINKTDEFEDFHSIHYTGIIPHLVNCIKNLKSEISDLKKIINNIKNSN